jgi:predicted TIM-barrel fold metal-dependent hydrolase
MVGLGLEKKILYPSDFPHERPTLEKFLCDVPRFRALEALSEAVKKLILRDNCIDFYSLKNPG